MEYSNPMIYDVMNSLRDKLAETAMHALIVKGQLTSSVKYVETCAETAYQIAEAMLDERKKYVKR